MKKLLIALAGAGTLLGASAASAEPYYHHAHGWHDRAWHNRAWHDRGWHGDWRRYHYGRPYYGHRNCVWRYGERVCW